MIGPIATVIDWLFVDAHAADMILAIMLVEFVTLVKLRQWMWWQAAIRLLPGALMIMALRAALTGAGWPWVALALALSFPAHLADIARRPQQGD